MIILFLPVAGRPRCSPDSIGVVVTGGVNEDEAGQEAVQIQTQMTLGGSLAAAMLGPVQCRGDPLDGGGVHDVDGGFEPVHQSLAATTRAEGG